MAFHCKNFVRFGVWGFGIHVVFLLFWFFMSWKMGPNAGFGPVILAMPVIWVTQVGPHWLQGLIAVPIKTFFPAMADHGGLLFHMAVTVPINIFLFMLMGLAVDVAEAFGVRNTAVLVIGPCLGFVMWLLFLLMMGGVRIFFWWAIIGGIVAGFLVRNFLNKK